MPANPEGIWILEGIPLAGKTTLLRNWRAACTAPVLWSAEDFASQRLFEPLEARHAPESVEPWLDAMVGAWERLQAAALAAPWSRMRTRFTAQQERFHLSARLERGLTPAFGALLEARLERLGAQGVLLSLDRPELERRVALSLETRPASWRRWLELRFGGDGHAVEAFLAQQEKLLEWAAGSGFPWFLLEFHGGTLALPPEIA